MDYLETTEFICRKLTAKEIVLTESVDSKGTLLTIQLAKEDYWQFTRHHGYIIKIIAKLIRVIGKKDNALVSLRLKIK